MRAGPLLCLLLAGCGSTERAAEVAQGQWIGRPADSFFAQNGAPMRQFTMADGGVVYAWETVSTPTASRVRLICSADIVADRKGTLREIRLKENTIGLWNISRCSEVFG